MSKEGETFHYSTATYEIGILSKTAKVEANLFSVANLYAMIEHVDQTNSREHWTKDC